MYENLIKAILLLPLIGFAINGLFGKKLGPKWSSVLGTSIIGACFIMAIMLFLRVKSTGAGFGYNAYTWISINTVQIDFSVWVDQLSAWMMLIITGIGFLIHLYSIGYMHDDEGIARFFAYLNLFIFSMLVLVMGKNLVMLFVGWEGVGLCSYLLIGFWFKNLDYGHAARKAFIMNRIGDLGLLIGIFICFQSFGTIDFIEIQSFVATGNYNQTLITVLTLCFFIGAMGKSAQIPLYTWLPDAMAGPTPVSALIHAATMVTAGIYFIVRCAGLFELAPFTMDFIVIIGMSTSILGAVIGLFQNDIKKVLAYSTVSQLGLMFVAVGVGAYTTAMFHLTTHAFFKALLFLGAGSVIHAMSGEQNILSMGGLRSKIKVTHLTFLLGTLAIIGAPFFSGFFSKDEILEKLYAHSPYLWFAALFSAAITIVYMIRVYVLTFWGDFRGTDAQRSHLHESPWTMTAPLAILALLSVFGGLLNLPKLIAGEASSQKLALWLSKIDSLLLVQAIRDTKNTVHHLDHSTEIYLMIGATALVVVLGMAAFLFYKKQKPLQDHANTGFALLGQNKFYVDEFYNWLFVKPLESLSQLLYYFFEHYIMHPIVFGSSRIFYGCGQLLKVVQNGNVEYYLLYISLGVLVLLAFLKLTI